MDEEKKTQNAVISGMKKSALWILKPSIGGAGYKQTTEDVSDSAKTLIGFVKEYIFSSYHENESLMYLKDIPDYQERFKQSMIAHNVRKKDLPIIEKNAYFRFMVNFVLLVLMTGYIIASQFGTFGSYSFNTPILILMSLCIISLLVARAARASFYLYQVKSRALVPFKVWLKDYGAWLGGMPSKHVGTLTLIGFGILAILHPEMAMADSQTPSGSIGLSTISGWVTGSGNVITKDSDLALNILSQLFPTGLPTQYQESTTTSSKDIWVPLFQIFNSVILAIASGMMAFQTLIGTIQSAHEGIVLGQKWSTAFAPVRICLGIGSLAPIKGYCLAQLFAIQVLIAGYAIANGIWDEYLDATMKDGYTVNQVPVSSGYKPGDIANGYIRSAMCYEWTIKTKRNKEQAHSMMANLWHRMFSPDVPIVPVKAPTIVNTSSFDDTTFVSVTDGTGGKPATYKGWIIDFGPLCGKVTFTGMSEKAGNGNGYTNTSARAELYERTGVARNLTSLQFASLTQLVDAMRQTSSDSMKSITKAGDQMAKSGFVDSKLPGAPAYDETKLQNNLQQDYSGAMTAEQNYMKQVPDATAKIITAGAQNQINAFVKSAKNMGWASAGSLNPIIMEMGAVIQQASAGVIPEYTAPDPSQLTDKDDRKDFIAFNKQVTDLLKDKSSVVNKMDNTPSITDGESYSGIFNKFWSKITNVVSGLNDISDSKKIDAFNPMQTIQAEGETWIDIALAIMVVGLGISVAVTVADNENKSWLGEIGNAMTLGTTNIAVSAIQVIGAFVASLARQLATGLLLLGLIEGYFIPMLPYILWLYAVLGCAAFAIEFVIAAPLAAFMHVRLDGDELIGQQQKPFYSLLFNGSMRPTLILFGLIAANKVFSVMADYTNQTYSISVDATSRGYGFSATVGWFAHVVILTYLHYNLAVKCLELVNRVPNMVTQMVGVQNHFEDPSQAAGQIRGAIIQMGSSNLSQPMSGAMSSAGHTAGELKKARDKKNENTGAST